ncbi:uncharacterized protein VTP21DRAFT_10023 [Calcarisporiella thermophila]|uniref:uncharacterized protein n=1 Tax=Calcarisporiella thermophila TaxID=911321 RepID=UPI00374362D0
MATETGPRRVKVYQLSEDNQWIDKGTGQCVYIELGEDGVILVRSEEDDSVLLHTKVIKREDTYQKQQESLIVWTEDDGTDLALSFQEAEGCAEIWNRIYEAVRAAVSLSSQGYISGDTLPESPRNSPAISPLRLPDPELSNLSEIEAAVREAGRSLYQRDKLVTTIINENYISKLLPFLEICEDLESLSDLHTLCNIMKNIICLNDVTIIENIAQDDVIMGVVGILEYDPDFPHLKANHREFLSKNSKFKQVVTIKDKLVEAKIHQTFRLQYLKDVVLARTLDDPTFSIISSIIFCNHVDIVQHLKQNHEFLKELFAIINNSTEERDRKRDVVLFLQQFCGIAKTLNIPNRTCLYRSLSQHGLFSIFDYALPDPEPAVKMAGLEILASVLEQDPNLVRSYILAQTRQEKKPLVETIIQRFLGDPDLGIKVQYAEVIRVLLDTAAGFGENGLNPPNEAMLNPKHDPETDDFLTLFYDRYAPHLFFPLMNLTNVQPSQDGHPGVLKLDREQSTLVFHNCELLSFMIRHHTFRSKYFVLSSNILIKVAHLFRCREKHLKLSALRVFRTCVGMTDDFYNRHLKKNNLLEPIVESFVATGNRNNLMNSACLELFEFIRRENIKSLIDYLSHSFGEAFKRIDYIDTFSQLMQQHEQNQTIPYEGSMQQHAIEQTPSRPQEWNSTKMDQEETENSGPVANGNEHETAPATRVEEATGDVSEENVSKAETSLIPAALGELTSTECNSVPSTTQNGEAEQESKDEAVAHQKIDSDEEAEDPKADTATSASREEIEETGEITPSQTKESEMPIRLDKRPRPEEDEDHDFSLMEPLMRQQIKSPSSPKKLKS